MTEPKLRDEEPLAQTERGVAPEVEDPLAPLVEAGAVVEPGPPGIEG